MHHGVDLNLIKANGITDLFGIILDSSLYSCNEFFDLWFEILF